jgi:hypothetical protein
MRAVLWGLIVSFVGFAGWVLFSLLFAIAKLTGAETAAGVFFITTFGVLCFFGLPVGAALDFATRRAKLRYFAYALIIVAVICWAGAISAGIMEEEAYKPAVLRGVNIVKEGPYADSVSTFSIPPLSAQYGEFKVDVTVAYLKPFGGPDRITVQEISVMTSGFELEHVEPTLPFNVGSSPITFTLSIKAPQEGFDGPLTLKITVKG